MLNKRLLVITGILIILLILVAGCNASVDTSEPANKQGDVLDEDVIDEVELNIDKASYDITETMLLTLVNNSETQISFGRPYTIEQYQDDEWVIYPLDIAFTMELILLEAGETFEQQVPLEELEAGEFRISKRIMIDDANMDIYKEFEIR